MQIKKAAYFSIIRKLEIEQNKLRNEISSNKFKMKHLVEQQTMKKRELAELQELIKLVSNKNTCQ